jgi:hypothetical protein
MVAETEETTFLVDDVTLFVSTETIGTYSRLVTTQSVVSTRTYVHVD